jgi:four helix bundle protein
MGPPPRLIEAARLVEDETNRLLDRRPRYYLHEHQLRKTVGSIAFNVREAYGRNSGPDRRHRLIIARGSAEEADEQWGSNYRSRRLAPQPYWRLHNRLMTIVKLIDGTL